MFCIKNFGFVSVRVEVRPPDISLLRFSHLKSCLSSFLLDGPGNSRCVLLGRAHICALGIYFCEVEKDGKGGCQTIGDVFFSHFVKKLRIEKLDDKLLEMLKLLKDTCSIKKIRCYVPLKHMLGLFSWLQKAKKFAQYPSHRIFDTCMEH
jgi:hypothetical protein